MTLKLYYAAHTCALASHIALEQAGANYEAIRLDLDAWEQRRPEFLAINPKGRVPALVTPRGVITETMAILLYVSQCFPASRLMPLDDPFALAEANAFNGYLSSTLHVAHAHGVRGYRWADDPAAIAEMKRKTPQAVQEAFLLVEQKMLKGPWVLGADYSACDAYLFTVSQWLEDDHVDLSVVPRIVEHRNRVLELDGVKKVLAVENR